MNPPLPYVYGSYRARILSDGSVSYYREILTPDGNALIGAEYPNDGYCWFNLTRAALQAGFTHEDIWNAEQSARDLYFDDDYVAAHLAELGVL
jgi:hypothetical protein